MDFGSLQSSPRTVTLDAADNALWDLNGLKTSVATAVTANVYATTGLNGALANPGPAVFDVAPGGVPARFVSVTTTASVGSYKTGAGNPIVVTGTRNGATVTESLLLTAANGNETIIGNQPFDTVVSIAVPAQNDTSGAFTFGVDGVAAAAERPLRAVRAQGTGNLKVGYQGGFVDTIPVVTGDEQHIQPARIYGNGGTSVKVTIYW